MCAPRRSVLRHVHRGGWCAELNPGGGSDVCVGCGAVGTPAAVAKFFGAAARGHEGRQRTEHRVPDTEAPFFLVDTCPRSHDSWEMGTWVMPPKHFVGEVCIF